MGRAKAPLLALLATLALSLGLIACGSDEPDLLPGETASDIKANLAVVRELSDAGDCVGAENAAAAVSEQVDALEGVDPELKQALVNGSNRLNAVVAECAAAEENEEAEAEGERETEERDAEREAEERDAEREAEREQKQQEREERETEREEKEQKEPEPKPEPEPETPTEPEEGGGTPSGGVSPSSPAEG